jgi:hypothetical protein
MAEESALSFAFLRKADPSPLSRVWDDTCWLFIANGRDAASNARSGGARRNYFDMLALRGGERDWLDAGTWRCA